MINRSAHWLRRLPEVFGLSLLAAAANGAVFWDETLQGDLSNNQNAPSSNPLLTPLTAGTYTVGGTVNGSTDFQDWLTITIQGGFQLSSVTLGLYTSANTISFTGVGTGTSFAGSPGVAGSYLGYTHFGSGVPGATAGEDVLPDMGAGAGSTGFTPPLGAGSYTFLIQEASPTATTYRFDYQITPIPEPSAGIAVGLLCAGFFFHRRWSKARAAANSSAS